MTTEAETITIIRGTVIEVGSSELIVTAGSAHEPNTDRAFVVLARNTGTIQVDGLTPEEARDIAAGHFGHVVSITIQRSDK